MSYSADNRAGYRRVGAQYVARILKGGGQRAPSGDLIATAGGAAELHRNMIVTLAARHKLPAVYFQSSFVAAGGLISYPPRSRGLQGCPCPCNRAR
jgi:hypothetical protein